MRRLFAGAFIFFLFAAILFSQSHIQSAVSQNDNTFITESKNTEVYGLSFQSACEQTLSKGRIRNLARHYDTDVSASNRNNRFDRAEWDAMRDDYNSYRQVLGSIISYEESFDLTNVYSNNCLIDGTQPTATYTYTPTPTATYTYTPTPSPGSCPNSCTFSDYWVSRCRDSSTRETCQFDNTYNCYRWVSFSCSYGQVCQYGQCAGSTPTSLPTSSPSPTTSACASVGQSCYSIPCCSGLSCQNGRCLYGQPTATPTVLPTATSTPLPTPTGGQQPTCGNGIIEEPERCDGTNLGGKGCQDFGNVGGTLECTSDCRFDFSECISSNDASSFKIAVIKNTVVNDNNVAVKAMHFREKLESEFRGKSFKTIHLTDSDCHYNKGTPSADDIDIQIIESCLFRKGLSGVVDKVVILAGKEEGGGGWAFRGGKYAVIYVSNNPLYRYMEESSFMHEMGHLFGLFHIDRPELRQDEACGAPDRICQGPNREDCNLPPAQVRLYWMSYCFKRYQYGPNAKKYIDSILSRYSLTGSGLGDVGGFEDIHLVYGYYNLKTKELEVLGAKKALGIPDEIFTEDTRTADYIMSFNFDNYELKYAIALEQPYIETFDESGRPVFEESHAEKIPFNIRVPANYGEPKEVRLFTNVGAFISGYSITQNKPIQHERWKIKLQKGWNMVSTPMGPVQLSDLASSCSIKGNTAHFYGEGGYERADRLEPMKGYWLYTDADCEAEVRSEEAVLLSTDLFAGWNMISGSRSWNDIKGGCEKTGSIWSWNPVSKDYEKMASYEELDPTKGYWVKVKGACTIVS